MTVPPHSSKISSRHNELPYSSLVFLFSLLYNCVYYKWTFHLFITVCTVNGLDWTGATNPLAPAMSVGVVDVVAYEITQQLFVFLACL
jgi:hypothetical protein